MATIQLTGPSTLMPRMRDSDGCWALLMKRDREGSLGPVDAVIDQFVAGRVTEDQFRARMAMVLGGGFW